MVADTELRVNHRLTIPAAELRISASRSSGPGGQHVNTSDTRIELRWNPAASTVLTAADRATLTAALASRLTAAGDLVLSCGTHRSQRRNRLAVQQRLVDLLRAALQPRRRRVPTRATKASQRRRQETKKRRSTVKRLRRKPVDDD